MRAIVNASRKSLSSLALPLHAQWPASLAAVTTASTSSSSDASTSSTPAAAAAVPPTPPPPHLTARNHSVTRPLSGGSHADLQYSLAISGNPSRVWGNYVTLLESAGYQRLPLELHQEVLRKCTPHFQKLRQGINKRMAAGNMPISPHLHENRFLTVIRNIRAAGQVPDLEDYNFILSQFAATGHYQGSRSVYEEILQIGHIPTAKTIGLCYQSIAHRFTLPLNEGQRAEVVADMREFFSKLMADTEEHKIPLTSANMDLSLRILKESLDLEGLESLLRTSYGVDLSYPDRLPLDIIEQANVTDSRFPLPFSLSALNTTLEILGRLGNISKMVQTFEVLTQPLPRAQDHFFSSFDEDEDDAGAFSTSKPALTPSYVTPNTTTYTILLRHLSKANHATLVRHYVLESISLAQEVDMKLRRELQRRPSRIDLSKIESPHFAITKSIIMPVLGYTNRRKNLSLMKWLSRKLPKIVKRKESDLEFYTAARERLRAYQELKAYKARQERAEADATTKSSSTPTQGSLEPSASPVHPPEPLDIDVSSTNLPKPTIRKPLNLSQHIRIIEQDFRELRSLAEYLDDLVGRTEQRVKERMGRRVWAGKNVFLVGQKERKVVSRDEWAKNVKFRPRRGTLVGQSTKWASSDYFSQNRRYFSTSFAGLGPNLGRS
ncbi:hypothetical protein BKA70DRAFT_1141543 [Coprinopsis sp. MPI-PUGE-AT-0042]|nr:hypothetical protein BKA70DRAFT_1141543 [Coprinopsis sp. MPI-PUGE-AT-0042]